MHFKSPRLKKRLLTCIALSILFCPLNIHALPGYFEPWGKDSELISKNPPPHSDPFQHSLSVKLAEQVILFHQNVLSKVDGPRSHFRPTSSRYMLLSMRKHGFIKGFIMGCDRLLRENDADWVYRTIEIDGKLFKHDPPR
jgi:uncharacterized protein